jgi:hypothetical protein
LPYYAIVQPTGDGFDTVGTWGDGSNGLIRNVDQFAQFLREPLEAKD